MFNKMLDNSYESVIELYNEIGDLEYTKESIRQHPFSLDDMRRWVQAIQHALAALKSSMEKIIETCDDEEPSSFIASFHYIMILIHCAYRDLFAEYGSKTHSLTIQAYITKLYGSKVSYQTLVDTLRGVIVRLWHSDHPVVNIFVRALDNLTSTLSGKPSLLAY